MKSVARILLSISPLLLAACDPWSGLLRGPAIAQVSVDPACLEGDCVSVACARRLSVQGSGFEMGSTIRVEQGGHVIDASAEQQADGSFAVSVSPAPGPMDVTVIGPDGVASSHRRQALTFCQRPLSFVRAEEYELPVANVSAAVSDLQVADLRAPAGRSAPGDCRPRSPARTQPDLVAVSDSGIHALLNRRSQGEATSFRALHSKYAVATNFPVGFTLLPRLAAGQQPRLVLSQINEGLQGFPYALEPGGGVTFAHSARQEDRMDAGPGPHVVAAGDLNCDGLDDIIALRSLGTSPYRGGQMSLLFNTKEPDASMAYDTEDQRQGRIYQKEASPDGTSMPYAVDFAPTGFAESGVGAAPIAVADFDDDGRPDVAVVNSLRGVAVFLNQHTRASQPGTPVLSPPVESPLDRTDLERSPYALAAGDLDGDHLPDLAVSVWTGAQILFLRNQGGGAFAIDGRTQLDMELYGRPPILVDLDRDGRNDLVFAPQSGRPIRVYLNRSAPGRIQFEATPLSLVGPDGKPDFSVETVLSFAAGDFDGDGRVDIAVLGMRSADRERLVRRVVVYRNRASK